MDRTMLAQRGMELQSSASTLEGADWDNRNQSNNLTFVKLKDNKANVLVYLQKWTVQQTMTLKACELDFI